MTKGKSTTSKNLPPKQRKPKKSHEISDYEVEKLKSIASHAKNLREAMNISYEQFALQSGINRNTYFRFENAAKTGENFTVALLIKVINGLGISLSEFMKDIME